MSMFSDVADQQARRDQRAGPMTWKQIEDFLTWAEAQLPPDKRRNRPRTHPAAKTTIPSP